uniref:Uncharacterized protein n=1 Tax=Anguilla anguilla TaxID=7936 RepID=A0A0E9S2Y7_ANGAN
MVRSTTLLMLYQSDISL